MLLKAAIIARNTFTEALRQPVYAVIISSALLLLIMSPAVAMYTLDEDIKLLREIGLSTLFLAGLFISIFAASSAVTEEIENKTITTVLSKPISRATFVFGKFIGVTAAVLLAQYICTIALLMAVRHGVMERASDTYDWPVIATGAAAIFSSLVITAFFNYIYDWNFPATAVKILAISATIGLSVLLFIDKEWKFNPAGNGIEIFDVYASLLLFMAVVVLTSLAVMFSTRFNVALTLLFCVAIFLLGLISDWIFGRFTEESVLARIGAAVIPNMQVFWISDAIYEESSIPTAYIVMGASYALIYTTAILLLAIALFQRRQVGD